MRSNGQILHIDENLPNVAKNNDLMIRTAHLLQSTADAAAGAKIQIDKRIPTGGGFGDESSDAATVLIALNALWSLALTANTLAELDLQLDANMPVFVHSHNA